MNSKAEVLESRKLDGGLNTLKWVLASCLVIGGLFGYHHYDGQFPVVYRALALVPVAAIAGYLVVTTVQGAAFWLLLREAMVEVRRVVWPTREETAQTTLVVVGVVFVMALVLWGLDAAFGKLVSLVIG